MLKQGFSTLKTLSSRIGRTCVIQADQPSLFNSILRHNKYNTSMRLSAVEAAKEIQDVKSGSEVETNQPKQRKPKSKTVDKDVIKGENLLISKTVNKNMIRGDRNSRESRSETLRSMGKQYKETKHFSPLETISGLNKALVTEELQRNICVTADVTVPNSEQLMTRAKHFAEQLGLEVLPNIREAAAKYPFTLLVDKDNRIKLQQLSSSDARLPGPIYSPFPSADLGIKAKFQYNLRSPLVRSLGKAVPLTEMRVVDATGGLGIDAFVLTYFGVYMTIIERNPIVYTLLREGYEIARQNALLKDMMDRITLIHGDSNEVLPNLAAELKPHVIYLDPMYPLRVKTNAPMSKKEMVIARKLLGPDPNAEDMVAMALKHASSHVVLKRPYYVEPNPNAVTAYKARSTRFEIYSKHKTTSFLGKDEDGDKQE